MAFLVCSFVMSVSIPREPGCPAVSEGDLLKLARGRLPEEDVQDLVLLMAKFRSIFNRWTELAGYFESQQSIDPAISMNTRARVAEAKKQLQMRN